MLRPSTIAACLLVLVGTIGCLPSAGRADGVSVELAFDRQPSVGDSTCTVRLTGADGAPLSGADLEVEGNMNHAGMVPVFGTAEESAPGLYQAPLEFTMAGDWFVIVRGVLADGRSIESIVDVPGVAASGSEGATPSCCQPQRP